MKNSGESPKTGYHGPKLDPMEFLGRVEEDVQLGGWNLECTRTSQGECLYYMQRGPLTGPGIYLSGGIHGDEPASAEAVWELMSWHKWPKDCSLHVFPLLNSHGMREGIRCDEAGLDLNRDYRHQRAETTRHHIQFLQKLKGRLDLAISLHEDWEAQGFYLYELPDEGPRGMGRRALDRLERNYPLDPSPTIDGYEAHYGLIHPSNDFEQRPEWPESVYLMAECGCPRAYTLEAPSHKPMSYRIQGLVEGSHALVEEWLASRRA